MITELTLKGFKSWRELGPMRFGRVTGLFGTNSSGKSSILHFLLMLKQTAESSDRRSLLTLTGKPTIVDLGSIADIIYGGADRLDLEYQVKWVTTSPAAALLGHPTDLQHAHGAKCSFDVHLGLNLEQVWHQRQSEKYEFMRPFNLFTFRFGWYYYDRNEPGVMVGGDDDVRTSNIFRFPELNLVKKSVHDELEQQFETLLNSMLYVGPSRELPPKVFSWTGSSTYEVGRDGSQALACLLSARFDPGRSRDGALPHDSDLEEQVSRALEEMKVVSKFKIDELERDSQTFRTVLRISPESPGVHLKYVGFGVSQLLPVVVQCLCAPKGSVIILEQPELHLHPSVQADLGDFLLNVAEKRDLQIIVESHSEHLLMRLQRRVAEGEIEKDFLSLYFCETGRDGASKLTTLDMDEFGNIRNWPKDFFGNDMAEVAAMTEAQLRRKGAGE